MYLDLNKEYVCQHSQSMVDVFSLSSIDGSFVDFLTIYQPLTNLSPFCEISYLVFVPLFTSHQYIRPDFDNNFF